MPQTAQTTSFKFVRLEGVPQPLLARHVENGRSHGPSLEAELASHDWDAVPCFVITRLRGKAPPPPSSLPTALVADLAGPSTATGRGGSGAARRPWVIRAATAFTDALRRAQQRRALSLLDRRLLDDIGVSPEGAQAEARKPPWRS